VIFEEGGKKNQREKPKKKEGGEYERKTRKGQKQASQKNHHVL